MSTIVTRAGKGSPLTHTEVDNNFTNLNTDKAEDNTVVKLTGDQTIAGTKTFSSTITGSISGNAGTVTDGVVTSGSYADPSWITSLDDGKVLPSMTGNSGKYLTTDGTNSSWDALATVANSGAYSDLSGTPTLATVATSGSYNDLSDKPTIPTDLNSLSDVTISSPATNEILKYNGTAWVNGTGGSSQWTTTGSDIYYNTGNVGIGTSSPAYKLHVYLDNGATAGATYPIIANAITSASGNTNSTGIGFINANRAGGAIDAVRTNPAADYGTALVFKTNSTGEAAGTLAALTERMRIDSAGVITSPLGGMQVLSATAVSASGTAVDFTGIPSWVKKITVIYASVSTNGTSRNIVQIGGSSGFLTSGYVGSASGGLAGVGSAQMSSGFLTTYANTAARIYSGVFTIVNITGDQWVIGGTMGAYTSSEFHVTGGTATLSEELTQIRITTEGGTNTYDSGTFNIFYE